MTELVLNVLDIISVLLLIFVFGYNIIFYRRMKLFEEGRPEDE